MGLCIKTIMLICSVGYVLTQYTEEVSTNRSTPSKKLLQKSGAKQIKSQVSSLISPISQTTVINQKFQLPIHRRRLSTESIPELPMFTLGIRGLLSSSVSNIDFEKNDETTILPIQANEQSHSLQQVQHKLKLVNKENEKDEDAVQVITNLGAISDNLVISATTLPLVSSSRSATYLYQQQTIPYRPIQSVSKPSLNNEPETKSFHQIIAPVQYRPQKPIRLHKQQLQQSQLEEHNEYNIKEAHTVKQRVQIVPKKSKPHSDYYKGRTKKPVAQVIRRYREETADGSIIWGFENDDGSFKEEIIGIDCITRGKYGYIDPDGLRREYSYETGIKCDEEIQYQQDQDILNTFVDYQENKLVLPSGKTIDLSNMGKKQARRPQFYRNEKTLIYT